MSTQIDGVKDDISFLRGLAEQGRRGPILGGAFLAGAGLIYGGASFLQWGISEGRLPIRPEQSGYLWLSAHLLFACFWVAMFMRIRQRFAARTLAASGGSNAAFAIVWTATAAGLMVGIADIRIVTDLMQVSGAQYLYAPIVFAFYGVAWTLAAITARRPWMYAVSAAAFACSVLMASISGKGGELLVLGAALLLTLFLPGLKLMFEKQS